jgi:hypothetical protein
MTAEWEAWSAPFLADPSDEAANAARAAQTRQLAAAILAAPVGAKVGAMTLVTAGWSRERGDQADAVAGPGSEAWITALGAHEHATLTADGKSANRQAWCECPGLNDFENWVRYEGWTARGCEAHGFVCGTCRRLAQTG